MVTSTVDKLDIVFHLTSPEYNLHTEGGRTFTTTTCNIFALFTRNFERLRLGGLIFALLKWFHVDGTLNRTNFQPVENFCGAV